MYLVRAFPNILGRAVLKQKIRDYRRAFGPLEEDVTTYIHQSNAQDPSGERMFSQMADHLYWARIPMLGRLKFLRNTLPVTMILGTDSWIPTEIGEVLRIRKDYTTIYKIRNCGHNVFCDQPGLFSRIVLRAAFAGVAKHPRHPMKTLTPPVRV